jgi:hypothetical protein
MMIFRDFSLFFQANVKTVLSVNLHPFPSTSLPVQCSLSNNSTLYSQSFRQNSVVSVRKRIIPTERPPLVGEVNANFSG